MNDANKTRVLLAVICGTFCLLIGLAQFLYSFLAFASVLFVDVLGMTLTLASAAIAVIPEKPYEIPYARALARTIAVTGMVFSVAVFVSGCRCFYRQRVSRIDLTVCAAICAFLAALHFMNSLSYVGSLYVIGVVFFTSMFLGGWKIDSLSTRKKQDAV